MPGSDNYQPTTVLEVWDYQSGSSKPFGIVKITRPGQIPVMAVIIAVKPRTNGWNVIKGSPLFLVQLFKHASYTPKNQIWQTTRIKVVEHSDLRSKNLFPVAIPKV